MREPSRGIHGEGHVRGAQVRCSRHRDPAYPIPPVAPNRYPPPPVHHRAAPTPTAQNRATPPPPAVKTPPERPVRHLTPAELSKMTGIDEEELDIPTFLRNGE